jgi:hypothetical protein
MKSGTAQGKGGAALCLGLRGKRGHSASFGVERRHHRRNRARWCATHPEDPDADVTTRKWRRSIRCSWQSIAITRGTASLCDDVGGFVSADSLTFKDTRSSGFRTAHPPDVDAAPRTPPVRSRRKIWFRTEALRTACAVVSTPSASRAPRRCFSTVATLRSSSSAMSCIVLPSATSSSTSDCRAVRSRR